MSFSLSERQNIECCQLPPELRNRKRFTASFGIFWHKSSVQRKSSRHATHARSLAAPNRPKSTASKTKEEGDWRLGSDAKALQANMQSVKLLGHGVLECDTVPRPSCKPQKRERGQRRGRVRNECKRRILLLLALGFSFSVIRSEFGLVLLAKQWSAKRFRWSHMCAHNTALKPYDVVSEGTGKVNNNTRNTINTINTPARLWAG